jgi:hypothetical protein
MPPNTQQFGQAFEGFYNAEHREPIHRIKRGEALFGETRASYTRQGQLIAVTGAKFASNSTT